jgi:hypothetical protein
MLSQRLWAGVNLCRIARRTLRTRIGTCACVNGLGVLCEMYTLLEARLTHFTRVRPFVGVYEHVSCQVAGARERLQAH